MIFIIIVVVSFAIIAVIAYCIVSPQATTVKAEFGEPRPKSDTEPPSETSKT